MERQGEFLFADGPEPTILPGDPHSNFYREITGHWRLPLGDFVRIELKQHSLAHLQGRLELSHAPDFPLDPRLPLRLRIGTLEFSSQQIINWSLL